MKSRCPWLILGPEPHYATCQRCGGQEPKPELPIDVDAFLKYSEYVILKHRRCEAKGETP